MQRFVKDEIHDVTRVLGLLSQGRSYAATGVFDGSAIHSVGVFEAREARLDSS